MICDTGDECYTIDNHGTTIFAKISYTKGYAASMVTTDNKLWISGGYNGSVHGKFIEWRNNLKCIFNN